jgi:hypothetical protein
MRLEILSQILVPSIQRLVDRFRETGSTGEKRRSGRPSVLSNDSLEQWFSQIVFLWAQLKWPLHVNHTKKKQLNLSTLSSCISTLLI